jgi:hypothetical protein
MVKPLSLFGKMVIKVRKFIVKNKKVIELIEIQRIKLMSILKMDKKKIQIIWILKITFCIKLYNN